MRLADCFTDLWVYVSYCLKQGGHPPTFDQFKANVQRLIDQSEALGRAGPFSPDDLELARFAVFAWIDEAVLSSGWDDKAQWQREQLQRRYFQTADAGELFFKRLNGLGLQQGQVREVYYLCLALGFTGQYCHAGDDYLLEQLKLSNLKLLASTPAGSPALDPLALFPEAYPAETEVSTPKAAKRLFGAGSLLCLVGPLVLYAALFIIYRFILSHVGQTLMSTVP
jgi:type VI secretion system protein ImpK